MKYLALLFLCFVLVGCATEVVVETPKTIDEPTAIALATKIAMTDNFHFIGAAQPPTNIRAKLQTLGQAVPDWQAKGYALNYDETTITQDTMVWSVMMDGIWPHGGPSTSPGFPTPKPWVHLAILLKASDGSLIDMAVP